MMEKKRCRVTPVERQMLLSRPDEETKPCTLCLKVFGVVGMETDHKVPQAMGGLHDLENPDNRKSNCWLLCGDCHHRKTLYMDGPITIHTEKLQATIASLRAQVAELRILVTASDKSRTKLKAKQMMSDTQIRAENDQLREELERYKNEDHVAPVADSSEEEDAKMVDLDFLDEEAEEDVSDADEPADTLKNTTFNCRLLHYIFQNQGSVGLHFSHKHSSFQALRASYRTNQGTAVKKLRELGYIKHYNLAPPHQPISGKNINTVLTRVTPSGQAFLRAQR